MENTNAIKTFNTLCKALDGMDLRYSKLDSDLGIEVTVTVSDIPITLRIRIDEARQLIKANSLLSLEFDESKRVEGAVATCVASHAIDGNLDYDFGSGRVLYRMTESFIDMEVSEQVCIDMIMISFAIIDRYNTKLLALSKGYITLEDFINGEED